MFDKYTEPGPEFGYLPDHLLIEMIVKAIKEVIFDPKSQTYKRQIREIFDAAAKVVAESLVEQEITWEEVEEMSELLANIFETHVWNLREVRRSFLLYGGWETPPTSS